MGFNLNLINKLIMSKLFKLSVVALVAMTLASCSLAKVEGDEVGVFVKKPWFFGSGGVEVTPLLEGSEWMVASTDLIVYKSVIEKYSETFDDIASDDGTPLDMTAHVFIRVIPEKAPILHKNYGQDWYDNNIKEVFRERVRNFISTYNMRSLISEREIYDTVKVDIMKDLKGYVDFCSQRKEFPIEITNVIVDKAKPNEGVLEELNNTAIYMQQSQTESMKQEMQKQRDKTEYLRAIADKRYQQTMNLSADQFIKLKALDVELQKIDMVKNKPNVNIDVMMGSSVPMWDIKQK